MTLQIPNIAIEVSRWALISGSLLITLSFLIVGIGSFWESRHKLRDNYLRSIIYLHLIIRTDADINNQVRAVLASHLSKYLREEPKDYLYFKSSITKAERSFPHIRSDFSLGSLSTVDKLTNLIATDDTIPVPYVDKIMKHIESLEG